MFKKSKQNEIYAPITGEVITLENVPDPVFSQKMMGEGIAVRPTKGEVLSPINGEVVQVAPSKHAVGILAEDGTEILIHVGLETVALEGEGFTVHVKTGDKVSVGKKLLDVDLDYIKEHAKDIISPIVITNSSTTGKEYNFTESQQSEAAETVLITY